MKVKNGHIRCGAEDDILYSEASWEEGGVATAGLKVVSPFLC